MRLGPWSRSQRVTRICPNEWSKALLTHAHQEAACVVVHDGHMVQRSADVHVVVTGTTARRAVSEGSKK